MGVEFSFDTDKAYYILQGGKYIRYFVNFCKYESGVYI